MLPPGFVDPSRVREPSASRERRVEVVGSKEREVEELAKMSRPAKAPARPTLPIRSKSIRGGLAMATVGRRSATRDREGIREGREIRVVLDESMASDGHKPASAVKATKFDSLQQYDLLVHSADR